MNKKPTITRLASLSAAFMLIALIFYPVYAAAPSINAPFVLSIAENSAPGTATTPNKVNAFDPEGDHLPQNQKLEFDIISGDGIDVFEIGFNTGIVTLKANQSLDFETKKSYTIQVRVEDSEGLSDTENITINVTDVPDETPVMNDQSFNVQENRPNGFTVGTIAFTDADEDDSHTFTITSGNGTGGGAFQISPTGVITVKDSTQLNFEVKTTFTLQVTVEDEGGLNDTATITINVTNVNEAPNVSDQMFGGISEAAANGTVVGTINATDPENQALTFTRTSGSAAFAVGETTGQITVANTNLLDFETNPSPTFVVTVTDSGGLSDTATITVNISDVNDPPRVTGAGLVDIFPNEGTTQRTVNLWAAFEDDEDDDDELIFTVEGNTNGSLFSSPPSVNNGNGVLTLNFAPGANGIAELTIRATDTGNEWVEDTFKIDFNEAPETTGFDPVSVSEDAGNTIINLYSRFSDAEEPSSALTYSIEGNTNPGLFTSVTINPPNIVLDYAPDAFGQANITIRATDSSDLFVQAVLNVVVNPVNDPPQTTSIPNVTDPEDADSRVINLALHFSDKEDGANGLTYSIQTNSNPDLFEPAPSISGTNLTLNYKENAFGEADIKIRATDKGNTGQPGTSEFVESTFTVTLTPVNDLPTLGNITINIDEDQPVQFKLSDFTSKFTDVDGDNLSSLRIDTLPAPVAGVLKLDGANVTAGQVILAANIDNLAFVPTPNWDEGSAVFDWNASDGTAYAAQPATVTIIVKALNDTPVVTDIEKTGPEGVSIIFAQSDFIQAFSDVDGDSLQKIKIISLPSNGLLRRGNVDLKVNDQIEIGQLDQIRYVPNAFFNGEDSFNWSGSDGLLYANPAEVKLIITPKNDPPAIDLNGNPNGVNFTTTFAAGGPPVNITSGNLSITDVDSTQIQSATVVILELKNGNQEKLTADTTGTAIVSQYSINANRGLLQLTGAATIADYVKVLKTVKYEIAPDVANPDLTQREIQFNVYDGEATSNDAFAFVNIIHPRIEISVLPESIQQVPKGGTALFTIEIENTGNVDLSNLIVTSDKVPSCNRDFPSLEAGESITTYACTLQNVQGRVDNLVKVEAFYGQNNEGKVADEDVGRVRVPQDIAIGVAPAPSVGETLVKGEDAEFIVTVINPSDSLPLTSVEVKAFINYDLANVTAASADEFVPVPACDKAIGELGPGQETQYSCVIPNVQASFELEVQAVGMIDGVVETENFDIGQISVLNVTLSASATPFEIPSGVPTVVEFNLTLNNVSTVPLTLTGLTSDLHGNLLDSGNSQVTDNTCPSLTLDIPAGEVRVCSYKKTVNVQPPALTNVITVTAIDPNDTQIATQETVIVSVGDFSALAVSLSASPASVVAPGGSVNLTVQVSNNTSSPFQLETLTEGGVTLDGKGNCQVPRTIPANSSYSCIYSVTINGTAGQTATRTVRATGDSLVATGSVDIPITATAVTRVLLPSIASVALAGEPNNAACAALPLDLNMDGYFYADDANDWYSFTIGATSNVRVRLSGFMVSEGQLLVYSGACTSPTLLPGGHNGELGIVPTRELVFTNLAPGTYRIWVLAGAGLNTTSPYKLEVDMLP